MRKVPTSRAPECMTQKYIGSAYDHVKTVSDHIGDVNSVADNIADVVQVAPYLSDINICANNMSAIVDAPNQASIAKQAAINASTAVSGSIKDMSGDTWFIGEGFKVALGSNNTITISKGTGYLDGIHTELTESKTKPVTSTPSYVYVDMFLDASVNTASNTSIDFIVTPDPHNDYVDSEGNKHYVRKIAKIESASDVEDLRVVSALYITGTKASLIYGNWATMSRVIVKDMHDAEFDILPIGSTVLGGDIVTADNRVASLVLKPINDIRWWGVTGDGSDEWEKFNNAYRRCAAQNVWLSGYGLRIGVGKRSYLPSNTKISDLRFIAVGTEWAANTADADNNIVGMPIISIEEAHNVCLEKIDIDCGLTTIDPVAQNIASAGIVFLENSINCKTSDIHISHYNGYGYWTKGKHTDSTHETIRIQQWVWGELGWFDVTKRTAYGWVNSSGDFMADYIVSNYNKSNIHIIAGAFTTLWGKVHPYNGSDEKAALDNITQVGGYGQVFGEVYLDNGFITLTDNFDIEFGIIKHVRTQNASNNTAFRLVTSHPDADARNLYVERINLVTNDLVHYSSVGLGSWSANKKHIFKSVTRKGVQTNNIHAYPFREHKISQTVGDRKNYTINSDGGNAVVDTSIGTFAVRETRYGSLFSGVFMGGAAKTHIAGNPNSDISVLPTTNTLVAENYLGGSNGTDFGKGSSYAPRVRLQMFSAENWEKATNSFGTRFAVSVTKKTTATDQHSLFVEDTHIAPGVDNVQSFGRPYLRATSVYAVDATIQTSDAREKYVESSKEKSNVPGGFFEGIPNVVLDAFESIPKVRFKWKSAITREAEGGTKARWHIGVLAQDIQKAFAAHGLDADEYGVFCYDEWEEQVIEHPEQVIHEYDDQGNLVTQPVTDEEGNTVLEPVVAKVIPAYTEVIPAGNRYGVRYEEAAVLDAAIARRNMHKIKQHLGIS